jgi:hypothetical protein
MIKHPNPSPDRVEELPIIKRSRKWDRDRSACGHQINELADHVEALADALDELNSSVWRNIDCALVEGTPVEAASLEAREALARIGRSV